jgi:poly(glycerol-phosphate) alpha-glucosyltransferase
MTVTMLSPSLSRAAGGIFEVERRLAHALHRLPDVEVCVVGLEDERTEADRAAWVPLAPTACATVGPDAFGYAPDLVDAILETDADIVHLHALWMYTSWAVQRWSDETGRPYVVSPHGMLDPWALDNAGWKKRLAGWVYENASLRGAACLHALNPDERQAIRDYGVEGPVGVVPNGVELPDEQGTPVPPWHGQGASEDRVLLFLGRIHPKKGLTELLEGWARLSGAPVAAPWRLAIVGWDDGGHLAELKERAAALGLSNDVWFLGPRYGDEKDAAFRHADGFILPSHSEGLPMAVLEAWSYRLPVLMTPQCNLDEGFAADAAFRIEPTPEGIADGLRTFIETAPDDREKMGERGRALVEAEYTWPQIARSLRAVYRWVLGAGERPECVHVQQE